MFWTEKYNALLMLRAAYIRVGNFKMLSLKSVQCFSPGVTMHAFRILWERPSKSYLEGKEGQNQNSLLVKRKNDNTSP